MSGVRTPNQNSSAGPNQNPAQASGAPVSPPSDVAPGAAAGSASVSPAAPIAPLAPTLKENVDVVIVPQPSGKWTCRTVAIGPDEKLNGDLTAPITVGEKFALDCGGDPVSLTKEKLAFGLGKDDKYKLKILSVRSLETDKAVLVATSYRTGEHKVSGVIHDGKVAVGFDNLELVVNTVINPQENPENKPYGPANPFAIPWPLWIWIGVLLVATVAIGFGVRSWLKSSQRRKLLAELARHGTALTPYNQFNKDLRAINRQFPITRPADWSPLVASQYMEELNRAFRWYLAREFIVPAFQWGPTTILRQIARKDGALAKRIGGDLRLALRELRRGMEAKEKLSAVDAQQLLDLCRKVADDVHRGRREAGA